MSKAETAMVSWEDKMAAKAKDAAASERPSVSTISFKSGVMKYMDQAVPENNMDVISISTAHEHALYLDRYEADKPKPPSCFAISLDGENMVPHPNVKEPQNPTCDGCKYLEWGSDLKGGRGKACKQIRRLGLVSASAEDLNKAELAMAKIPVTSVGNWANYVNSVSAMYNRPPDAVITNMSVIPDAKTQFKVLFNTAGLLTEEQYAQIESRLEMVQNMLMTPYDVSETAAEPEEGNSKKY